MAIELYLAFVAATALLALTPGPAMSLIIANGTSHGTGAGLLTVGGNTSGLALLVAGAALGMAPIMAFMADWFDVVRFIGAAYLIWLGASRLRRAWRREAEEAVAMPPANGRCFWQGFVVALSNPKVLLFLGALFPQFIDPAAALGPQLGLLAVTFLITATLIDSAYALAAGVARNWFTARRRRLAEGFSGSLLIGAGLWLALARRA